MIKKSSTQNSTVSKKKIMDNRVPVGTDESVDIEIMSEEQIKKETDKDHHNAIREYYKFDEIDYE